MQALENALFAILNYFYGWVHDYGFAIVLLTVAVRVVLLPLTVKQIRSMHELQRIQPKLKALQEKYKNDKEKLQAETLKFYEEHKVNPFGGCLPTLLQFPILIALYRTLGGTPEKPGLFLKHIASMGPAQAEAAKRFWVILPDLTSTPKTVFGEAGLVGALPYILLVVLFGLSVYLPQVTQSKDRQQRMIGLYMAVMMLFFGWSVPAGVLVYWVTSSVLQLVQQYALTRAYSEKEVEK
ncbi:YidC/Oxa1 family membrane protein insertase [Coriobacteriia bacterium Es71-Z0120]|uniref:YidC/Oxa1 family membrane protein insertase n=1 Tax=Parvivirga hydrogeniphila TaxID=2939460 RepID=UPI002260D22D|nr:YidC/Oxa1 family membrane protein insertase [Parvivirga hydrogeniphila]MCL4078185.1 YidC/Oxa1 family membrane protein insertase [Parvivirga hydrogeniphila]